MIELILFIILCGVFWRYGKEMGAGKWSMILTFIGCWIGISVALPWPIPFLPLIASAIITSILGVTLSVMNDQQKKKRVLEKMETQKIGKSCGKCGLPVTPEAARCFRCGASLAR